MDVVVVVDVQCVKELNSNVGYLSENLIPTLLMTAGKKQHQITMKVFSVSTVQTDQSRLFFSVSDLPPVSALSVRS